MILGMSAGGYYLMPSPDYSLMHASLFNIYNKIAEESKLPPPDLAIIDVEIKKIDGPKDYFNSYRYAAEIKLKNYGGEVKKGEIIIKSAGRPEVSLGEDFKMVEGGGYLVKDLEFFFDADYNFGEIPIEVELRGGKERELENNIYLIDISEMPAKIEVKPEDLFKGNLADLGEGVEIFVNDSVPARQVEYGELTVDDEVISYHKIQNTRAIIDAKGWKKVPHYDGEGYVYLGKKDPETGSIAVSDVWSFSEEKPLSRGGFAKIFVEATGERVDAEGLKYFEDVEADSEYAPYVQTLYNLGLIGGESGFYSPDEPMSRGEALRIVMDYFDVDLFTETQEGEVGGVEEDYEFYPYVAAVYARGEGEFFTNPFEPEKQATEEFIKTLINLYE